MLDLSVDPAKRFRQALGTFATGVTVATTIDELGKPRGFTANSFTSVSLDPPLILICLANSAAGCPVFSGADRFCVNVLAEDQQHIAALFASPSTDRFGQIEWHSGKHGIPVIDGAISWFECERYNVVDAGDHCILIGKVADYEISSRSPLIYCSGSYVEFGLLQRAMEVASLGLATRISAVVDCHGQIPMARDATTGRLSLPVAKQVGDVDEVKSLVGKLAANGILAAIPFVCAVYEDARSKTHNVVYRGSAESVDTRKLTDYELVSLDAIPWPELVDAALQRLLERYCEERASDAFGVYVGDAERGEVHTLGTRH
ncbi:MAG: flavin reductase family protein [Gammaproteobacteria bacterium]|nr:flavin reductase family protein [Gammaproteobacteria bacterium]